MPKIQEIIDFKPQNELVVDHKPKNELVLDHKPKGEVAYTNFLTEQLYSITLGAGMLVGFGPAITYPTNIDIISSKSP